VAAISARELDSELVSLAKLLGALGDPSATDALIALTSHPRHFVRWAALQALGLIDGEKAGRRLRDFTDDRHPEIAAMASKLVERHKLQEVG
jgi:HEAT repeat protein